MSRDTEVDLFTRSLGGDLKARVSLYKKFFHENSRVRRLGAHYSSTDDFLHDCFANALRARQTLPEAGGFAEYAEAVAVWTALEYERLRASSGDRNFVRMCAADEGDEAGHRSRLASYVPPRSASQDTLPSRISAIVGEPQFTLLRALAMENTTWEHAAASVGKPVSAIGPVVVRAIDRLSRFFGAPPPLNSDLEHVFFEVSAKEAAAKHTDPLTPRGRVISMQLDPPFYRVTPESRKIGLTVPPEVRTIALWDAARASAPPGESLRDHLARCRYCSGVLRSLLLMQQAARSGVGADFLLCPGASTLLQDPDEAEETFHQHLNECGLCRDERTRALFGEDRSTASGTRAKLGWTIAWVAAAAVILCGLLIARLRHSAAEVHVQPPMVSEELKPRALDTRYADLAERIPVDDQRLFASVLPRSQFLLMEAIADLRSGKQLDGKFIAEKVANENNDPGAQVLYAECLYGEGAWQQGYREMQKAEAMSPRNSFRCWLALHCALMVGDKAVAEREIGHLSSDPDYGTRARVILAKLKARK